MDFLDVAVRLMTGTPIILHYDLAKELDIKFIVRLVECRNGIGFKIQDWIYDTTPERIRIPQRGLKIPR